MTPKEKAALRARHTCIKAVSSLRCHACNNGVPYPALTLEEIDELLDGGREAEAAMPALLARPGRRR